MRGALLIAVVVALGAGGCSSKSSQPPGGARGSKADAARKKAEALAVGAVAEAAANVRERESAGRGGVGWAGQMSRALPAVQVSPSVPAGTQTPKPPAVPQPAKPAAVEPTRFAPRSPVREVVSNQLPTTNQSDAENDLYAAAQDVIERRLAELDPPVRYRPTTNEVKNEFLRRDTRYAEELGKVSGDAARSARASAIREVAEALDLPPGETEKLQYVECYVEVTADQVRGLRTRERLEDGLKMLGLVTAAAVAGLMFLRLDQWTRGHLTRVLAIAAVTLAVAAAVGLYLL
ncbi:MAG TPA: hypothetical protein VM529_09950 [Gemmata sp.]|nr:hypothetical protein [Gemmata sp.]